MNSSSKLSLSDAKTLESYLSSRRIHEIFESLMSSIIRHRPNDHLAFLEKCIHRMRLDESTNPNEVRSENVKESDAFFPTPPKSSNTTKFSRRANSTKRLSSSEKLPSSSSPIETNGYSSRGNLANKLAAIKQTQCKTLHHKLSNSTLRLCTSSLDLEAQHETLVTISCENLDNELLPHVDVRTPSPTEFVEPNEDTLEQCSDIPHKLARAIDQLPLFSGCDLSFKRNLAMSMVPRKYKRCAVIVKKGDMGKGMYFIMRGTVQVESEDGETIYAELGPGNFFGQAIHVVSGKCNRRTGTIRASTECFINVLIEEKFEALLNTSPAALERVHAELKRQYYLSSGHSTESLGGEFLTNATSEILKHVPLFKECHLGFLHKVALTISPRLVQPGEYIIRKGEIGSELFIVVRGVLEVVSEDGKIVYVRRREGEFVGEIAVLYELPRTFSVRAQTACDLLVLTKKSLDKVMEDFPSIAQYIRKVAKSRLEFAENMKKNHSEMLGDDVNIENVITRIKLFPWFATASDVVLKTLAESMKAKVYAPDDMIYDNGDVVNKIVFIVDGCAIQYIIKDDNVHATLTSGSAIGIVEAIKGIPCRRCTIAKDTLLSYTIDSDTFYNIVTESTTIMEELETMSSEYLRDGQE